MDIANLLVTIFYFLIVLGVLVLVHEIGHFMFAKRFGVRVEEFGIGYPPRALTLHRGKETVYTLNWLPLGGFVRMTGEENPSDPRSFAAQRPLVRTLILVAGAGMNVLLAIVLFTLIAMTSQVKTIEVVTIDGVSANSPAEAAGIRPGDQLVAINGQPIENRQDAQRIIYGQAGQEISIQLKRG